MAGGTQIEESQSNRYALVTGGNRGIGLEIVKQIAAADRSSVTVLLTARDENKGVEATLRLQRLGFSNVVFHQLDVRDPDSISRLENFIRGQYGRLDILVNNAGVSGAMVDEAALKALNIDPETWLSGKAAHIVQSVIKVTPETAKECLDTNYYGVKRLTEALLPLLQKSTFGANVVNVSSLRSELKRIPNEKVRKELGEAETLTEEKIDRLLEKFMVDLQAEALEENGWSTMIPAYSISKAMLNGYTRILAKRFPEMRINCVHPGYVKTDINWNTGTMPVEEGAKGPVMLALLSKGDSTGCYFDQTEVAEY